MLSSLFYIITKIHIFFLIFKIFSIPLCVGKHIIFGTQWDPIVFTVVL
jgi:hypothetical protein